MFKLSIHEKIENEREKVYLCRKEMFHLLIYIRYGKDIWFRNHKKRARASGGHSFSTSHCESVRLQR
jgi:hypothetical protein